MLPPPSFTNPATLSVNFLTISHSLSSCFVPSSPIRQIDGKNKFVLGIIGYVGVSLSAFCMIATIFFLTFLK